MFDARFRELLDSLDLSAEQRKAIDGFVARTTLGESATVVFQGVSHETARTVYEAHDVNAVSLVPVTGGRALDEPSAPFEGLPEKYIYGGLVGRGGAGDVHRVRDRELNRWMALKVINRAMSRRSLQVAQFIEEAQVTAQLTHPGVVPVHELGELSDGRLYFTMKEVQGQTLSRIIDQTHKLFEEERWCHRHWYDNLAKLVGDFKRVCETVAYAHKRGVIHRDLKPDNIMVGSFGEVYVMDWGLAWILDRLAQEQGGKVEKINAYITAEMRAEMHGQFAGTPAYMPPEQIKGETERYAPQTDVYALGAVLYELLTWRAPYEASSVVSLIAKVLNEDPMPAKEVVKEWLSQRSGPAVKGGTLPEKLFEICTRAMARDPADRYEDASAMLDDLQGWLSGTDKRNKALEIYGEAMRLRPQIEALRGRVKEIEREASVLAAQQSSRASLEEVKVVWSMEQTARVLSMKLEEHSVEYLKCLRSALVHDPEMPEAHERLAEHHRHAHEALEREGQVSARRDMNFLRFHDQSGLHAKYIQGDGALTLWTDPPGVSATLFRYEERDRRLIPTLVRQLGATPLNRVPLPMGDYMVLLRAEGCHDVRYPIRIERQRHWRGVAPGGVTSEPVKMPKLGELAEGEVYVPGGWFGAGGRHSGYEVRAQEVWVDPFIMQQYPVTQAQYLAFLNDLVDQGRHEEVKSLLPRRQPFGKDIFNIAYAQDARGHYHLDLSKPGMMARPDWPILKVNWESAVAYSRWFSARRGQPWRLPGEMEWEKAARGADRRLYPWGNQWSYLYANTHTGEEGGDPVQSVFANPYDESPYGVRGFAGNVRDWCHDLYVADPVYEGRYVSEASPPPAGEDFPVCIRGGAWFTLPASSVLSMRIRSGTNVLSNALSFRLVRSF